MPTYQAGSELFFDSGNAVETTSCAERNEYRSRSTDPLPAGIESRAAVQSVAVTTLSAALVVLVIGSGHAQTVSSAFEAAARGVLGAGARIEVIQLDTLPSDDETVARARGIDGVVELIWTKDGTQTKVRCYVSKEQRWVDREISFGGAEATSAREVSERGRLLGYAVATMFTDEDEPTPPASASDRATPPAPSAAQPTARALPPALTEPVTEQASLARRAFEFSGVASSGLGGTASGLGAGAGVRASLGGVFSARVFFAGREGNIAHAQASTRDARLGAGLAIAVPLARRRLELGLRSDGFVSYFDATHFSEDDELPDRRSRWLPGADLVAEAGFRFAGNAGIFAGLGVEAVLGRTDLYTHGQHVAVVPVLRAVGELGFRIGF